MKQFLFAFSCFCLIGCSTTTPSNSTPQTPDTSPQNRTYVSKDPESCKAMRFGCDAGKKHFFDETGCGCEEDPEFAKQNPDSIICTEEYLPVCGEIEVQCIQAPCPPAKETFDNKCYAKAAGAKNIKGGTCQTN